MLKVKMNDQVTEVYAEGTLREIENEVLNLIDRIYSMLEGSNKKQFKNDICNLLPVCFREEKKFDSLADQIDRIFKEIMK